MKVFKPSQKIKSLHQVFSDFGKKPKKPNNCAIQPDLGTVYRELQTSVIHLPNSQPTPRPTALSRMESEPVSTEGCVHSLPCLCIAVPSGHFLFLLCLCCTIPHQKYICSGAYFLKTDNLVKSLPLCFHLQFQTSSSTTCSSKNPFYSHEKEVNDPLI